MEHRGTPRPSAFEFENWAVIAPGGIHSRAQIGDMGIDGRILPVSEAPKSTPTSRSVQAARAEARGSSWVVQVELSFLDVWYAIQVKQKGKVGRPDIDTSRRS